MLCVVELEVSALGYSFVQKSPTECGASNSVCNKTLVNEEPRPEGAVASHEK
jgi:hypothetical protein